MRRLTWLATIAVLISAVLWVIGISLAIISFNRSNTVPYSCWNHVISELGFPYASRLTWVFNGTVAIGGLLLLPTLYALGAQLRTRLGTMAVGFGYVACLSVSAVGMMGLKQDFSHAPYIFLRFLKVHLAISDVFFLGWLVTVTLFTVVFYRRWEDPAARFMVVTGMISWSLYPVFLLVAIYANPMQAPLLKSLRDPAFRAIIEAPTSSAVLSPWLDCHRPRFIGRRFWSGAWSGRCGFGLVRRWYFYG